MESLQQAEQRLVQVESVSLVKPSKPTQRHLMYMSGVDQMLRLVSPNRTLLFYRTASTDGDYTEASRHALEALKLGISAALVPYYPMAGRLVVDDADCGRLAIDCNDEGVELIQAHCHELSFAELESNHFGMRKLFSRLIPMDKCETSDYLAHPLASLQVTSFKGGLTVGVAAFHSVVDGHAMWDFIRAVSRSCRGEPLLSRPLHARILLKPDVLMMSARLWNVTLEDLSKQDEAPYNGCMDVVKDSKPNPELQSHKVMHFSQDMLNTLKKACLASLTNKAQAAKPGFFVSTYQALTAYLWKRLTLARGLNGNDVVALDFRLAVDIRMRMTPALTPVYFGNAVVGVPTPCTPKELLNESLGDTALRIRQSLEQVNDIYIRKALIAREKADLRRLALSNVHRMMLRNASGFPVYEAGNFGWGEPDAVRPPWDHIEGHFTCYPSKLPKSLDVIGAFTEAGCTRFFASDLYPNDPLHPYALHQGFGGPY